MPVFRKRWALRIVRGLKGFVGLEAGVTRGEVPSIELLEAQVRELGQARDRLKAQIAQRDRRIEKLSQPPGERPVDTGFAPRRIGMIRSKLYSLGFVDRALEELHYLAVDRTRPAQRKLAAWELSLWYANQYSEEGARQSLELLPVVLQDEDDPARVRRAAIIEAESQNVLGNVDAAKLAVSRVLEREPHADLFLARANLEGSVPEKMEWINEALRLHGIPEISYDVSPGQQLFDSLRLRQGTQDRVEVSGTVKVSVLIPAYNAEDVIRTALDSLLCQTWTNLEVLVVDDCSTDSTASLVEGYAEKDSRVHLIRSEANSGTYVARNLALEAATGEFVTCHDADDWSHPEKIERQARHLLSNPSVMGNTSQHARANADLEFDRRGNPGFYIFKSMSSFMFRRELVMETLGYWDCVRFSADGEFTKRVKRIFGDESVVDLPTGPLSFLRQSGSSLTGHEAFGMRGPLKGARKEYRDAYTYFHDSAESLRYKFSQSGRPFPAPEPLWPRREVKGAERRHFDVVLVSDFRLPGGTTSSNVEEIKAQKRMGLRTGLIHMQRYNFNPYIPINWKIREMQDGDAVQMLVYGEKISCDVLIARYPPSLQDLQKFVPDVEAANVYVIVNQTPMRDYSEEEVLAYEIGSCEKNLRKQFGKAGVWYPIGPAVRKALHEHHADELEEITLADEDWSNIIDVNEWWRGSRPPRGRRPRIGRHSRDAGVKWPVDLGELLAAYPDSDDYEVHVLGGAETPEKLLGGLPENWHVLEFGTVHPKDFLSTLDVFVYYTHPDLVEAFGRTIIEAMATGVPAILPHSYRELFGEAAIYATPSEVQSNIDRLMADEDYYESQVNTARDYVEKHFGYTKHVARLGK